MSQACKKQTSAGSHKAVPTPKPEPAEGWSFVNVSEPKQSKEKSFRQLVRSNAMRDYRQKKKQGQTRQQSEPADTTDAHAITHPSLSPDSTAPLPAQKDEHGYCSRPCGHTECVHAGRYLLREMQPSPKQLVGDGGIDPFDALPIRGDSQYHASVLNHFDLVIAQNFLPAEIGRGPHPLTHAWLQYTVSDPLLLRATLNFAAAHLDIMHGRPTSPMTIAQKGEIIRLISMRIQESAQSLSDTTIGAVAMLAAMESTTGNHHELNVHMDALEKMVRMRGGLQQLGWDGVLQMFISWQDLLSSSLLSAPPHFPRPPNRLIVHGDIPPHIPICPHLGALIEVCAEMINNYNDMRYLTDLLSDSHPLVTNMEQMHIDSVRNSLKHRFLSLNIRKPKVQMQDLDYLLESCRIAALIFLNRAFHDNWPRCAIIRQLKSQMKELLLEKETHITEEVLPQEQWGYYTWALFMGGIHSQEREDTAFFAKRIAKSSRIWQEKGFTSWQQLLHLIKRVGWTDALESPECDALGVEVEKSIKDDDTQDHVPSGPAHTCLPAAFNTILTAWSSAARFSVVCCSASKQNRPHLLPLLMSRSPLDNKPDLESLTFIQT